MTTPATEDSIAYPDTGIACETCAGKSFRRSKLQWKDMGSLVVLQYPVRCLSCGRRQSVALAAARRAVPSSVKQMRTTDAPGHDGTPWSAPVSPAVAARNPEAGNPEVGLLEPHRRVPVAMPNLHGIKLAHVAHVPPGDGENLVQ